MILQHGRLALQVLIPLVITVCISINYNIAAPERRQATPFITCVPGDESIRAKRKTCLLRPDSGPCRADILVWYYDAKQQKCYRFFWGGCQGNGNNFQTEQECLDYCYLKSGMERAERPKFCSLAFDFGTCFGQYNRWGWDKQSETCRRRLYSGCGGNQNNFETKKECMATCLLTPNNTFSAHSLALTTCIPFTLPDYYN